MAPHSSTLAWKIPWMEEPGGLQSMGSLRVRHNQATSLSLSLSCIGEGNGNPLQCSCLENPRDGGAWWAAVYGVSQSRTWLKQLSSSSHWKPWNSFFLFHEEFLRETLSFSFVWAVNCSLPGSRVIRHWSPRCLCGSPGPKLISFALLSISKDRVSTLSIRSFLNAPP